MTPADLQIPERESAPVVDDHAKDPAVVASKEAEAALAAWLASPHSTQEEEAAPEFQAAEKRRFKAEADFAAAPVASYAGALVKLRALLKDLVEDDAADYATGHVRTVLAFLEGFTGAPPVVDDDHPDAALLALGQEYAQVVDLWAKSPGTSDDEANAFLDHASRLELQICDTKPRTPAGLVVLVKLLASFQAMDPTFTDQRDAPLSKNILAALERLTPGLADVERGSSAAESDPVVALFAEWGTINEEAMVLSAAIPEGAGKDMKKTPAVPGKPWVAEEEKEWDAALDRRDAVERQIMDTPATSMRGVAVKIRLGTHNSENADLTPLYATPAREIDYEKEWGSVVDWDAKLVISALLDAERLAGVS